MAPFAADLAAALLDGGLPGAEETVAEGLAAGMAYVINRHSVSPGGLRWASAADLEWLDYDDPPARGSWLLGTGFVVAREVV